MIEALLGNGTDLSTLVRNIPDLSASLRSPARRGSGLVVPGRHGVLRRADRPFDAGGMDLPFWVIGADAVTGAPLSGDPEVTSFYQRVDELLAILHAPVLEFTHVLPTEQRRVLAELADEPLDFTRELGSPLFGSVTAPLVFPDAFWFDPVPVEASFSVASGGTAELVEFAGATAPMTRLQVTFTGPCNNPELRQPSTGSFLAYDGVIGTGQSLTVDCDDEADDLLVGSGGLVPDYTRLRYRPPRWFELDPTADLTVSLIHTGGGSASCTVAGLRRFLTG